MTKKWYKIAPKDSFPENGGRCILYKGSQIAVFHFSSMNKWYACQNLCPHKQELVLSRGLLGDEKGEPKVSCPMHKRNFSLETGHCLNDDAYDVTLYEVKEENGFVYLNTSNL